VEAQVTIPLEAVFQTTTNVQEVTTTSMKSWQKNAEKRFFLLNLIY
jgi:hypothetical protein